jgi:hypothetical protein
MTVLVAPLVEELVFRGTLFRAWRARWNPVLALLASSLLFGALHTLQLAAFLTAVTFALLYTRTCSLWAKLLAHCLNNPVTFTSRRVAPRTSLDFLCATSRRSVDHACAATASARRGNVGWKPRSSRIRLPSSSTSKARARSAFEPSGGGAPTDANSVARSGASSSTTL